MDFLINKQVQEIKQFYEFNSIIFILFNFHIFVQMDAEDSYQLLRFKQRKRKPLIDSIESKQASRAEQSPAQELVILKSQQSKSQPINKSIIVRKMNTNLQPGEKTDKKEAKRVTFVEISPKQIKNNIKDNNYEMKEKKSEGNKLITKNCYFSDKLSDIWQTQQEEVSGLCQGLYTIEELLSNETLGVSDYYLKGFTKAEKGDKNKSKSINRNSSLKRSKSLTVTKTFRRKAIKQNNFIF